MFQNALGQSRGSTYATSLAASTHTEAPLTHTHTHTHTDTHNRHHALWQSATKMVAYPGSGRLTSEMLKGKGRLPRQWVPSQIPRAKGNRVPERSPTLAMGA